MRYRIEYLRVTGTWTADSFTYATLEQAQRSVDERRKRWQRQGVLEPKYRIVEEGS